MNINSVIEKAFQNFTVNQKHIPIAFLNYTGKSDAYLTYYTWQEHAGDFYDDQYHAEISYGTVSIFSTGNFKEILRQVKQKLKENGFTWTDNGPETFERDTGYYHVPVNFFYSKHL